MIQRDLTVCAACGERLPKPNGWHVSLCNVHFVEWRTSSAYDRACTYPDGASGFLRQFHDWLETKRLERLNAPRP